MAGGLAVRASSRRGRGAGWLLPASTCRPPPAAAWGAAGVGRLAAAAAATPSHQPLSILSSRLLRVQHHVHHRPEGRDARAAGGEKRRREGRGRRGGGRRAGVLPSSPPLSPSTRRSTAASTWPNSPSPSRSSAPASSGAPSSRSSPTKRKRCGPSLTSTSASSASLHPPAWCCPTSGSTPRRGRVHWKRRGSRPTLRPSATTWPKTTSPTPSSWTRRRLPRRRSTTWSG